MTTSRSVTALLADWSRGNQGALEHLLPLVYAELRRIAARQLRKERSGHTLQPTALVHEVYLRLVDQRQVDWRGRAHFFGVAAQMMRRILVDHARDLRRAKRGGGALRVSLSDVQVPLERAADLVALDDALTALETFDPRKGRVIELRYFGGLSLEETAAALEVSVATVRRDWSLARAWLYRELVGNAGNPPDAGVRGE
jgi:RNA polymerase sigma factor (TIGR02999 family)